MVNLIGFCFVIFEKGWFIWNNWFKGNIENLGKKV